MSKYALKKKKEYLLSEESATEQIVELLTYYDIDVEKIGDNNEAGAASLETILDNLNGYVRQGVLEVVRDKDSKLTVVHTLTSGDKVTYGEVSAKAKLAMDKFKQDETYRRIYGMMGSLSGLGSAVIEKMSAHDLSVVEALGTVFSNA